MSKPLVDRLRRRLGAPAKKPASPPAPVFPRVDVFEWRPKGPDGKPGAARNFGDHLAAIVPGKLLADGGYTLEDQVPTPRRLFTVGSVLHFASDGDVVWGSGVNGKIAEDRHLWQNLDVRAVRGPLTAEFLRKRGIACPDVFGDPALLLPTLFAGRFSKDPVHDHVIVPNLHDLPLVGDMPNVVSPYLGWNRVVQEILRARLVIASSLHGLIIADAFGIPARYIRLSETEAMFKYQDYAFGCGRIEIDPASSVEEAIEMGGMPLVDYDPSKLIAAFPWDLWKGAV